VEILRKAIESGSETCVLLINYTSDGAPFWNRLFIATLRDTDDTIINFVSGSKRPWLRYPFLSCPLKVKRKGKENSGDDGEVNGDEVEKS
jgi:hypothetical protein